MRTHTFNFFFCIWLCHFSCSWFSWTLAKVFIILILIYWTKIIIIFMSMILLHFRSNLSCLGNFWFGFFFWSVDFPGMWWNFRITSPMTTYICSIFSPVFINPSSISVMAFYFSRGMCFRLFIIRRIIYDLVLSLVFIFYIFFILFDFFSYSLFVDIVFSWDICFFLCFILFLLFDCIYFIFIRSWVDFFGASILFFDKRFFFLFWRLFENNIFFLLFISSSLCSIYRTWIILLFLFFLRHIFIFKLRNILI